MEWRQLGDIVKTEGRVAGSEPHQFFDSLIVRLYPSCKCGIVSSVLVAAKHKCVCRQHVDHIVDGGGHLGKEGATGSHSYRM